MYEIGSGVTTLGVWPSLVLSSALESSQLAQAVCSLLKYSPPPPSHREKKRSTDSTTTSVRPTRARAAHGPRLLRAPNVRSFPRLSKAPSANWCSSPQLVIAAVHGVVFGLGLDSLRHGTVFFSIQELGCRTGGGCLARVVGDTWFLGELALSGRTFWRGGGDVVVRSCVARRARFACRGRVRHYRWVWGGHWADEPRHCCGNQMVYRPCAVSFVRVVLCSVYR
jgi:hypothetical protein